MWPNPQDTADLATFTEEIPNRFIFCAALALPGITFSGLA